MCHKQLTFEDTFKSNNEIKKNEEKNYLANGTIWFNLAIAMEH